jgi:exodeoxyribonuclease VII small subunit
MSDAGIDFEKTLRDLEAIAGRLDSEELDLDEAISLFEQGIAKLRAANRWLDEAQGRVEELIATATGRLETRPIDGERPNAVRDTE